LKLYIRRSFIGQGNGDIERVHFHTSLLCHLLLLAGLLLPQVVFIYNNCA